MSQRMNLKPEEIELLGLQKKGNTRYYINKENLVILYTHRGYDKALIDECVLTGISIDKVSDYWHKSEHFSLRVREEKEGDTKREDFARELIEEIKDYSPTYPTIRRTKSKDGHLLVVDIADLHINKYADGDITGAEYNSEIAVERALSGTRGLIDKASGFDIEKIIFVIGNDVLNTDTLFSTTTKGTHQDCDVSWYKAFNMAKDCYIKCIELCMQVAEVSVIHCPSNHDLMSGCFLAETLAAWFRLSKNITFDISPKYRKYQQFYSSMLEFEHGDKGKMLNLPLTMANEEPQMWADTKFRYGYLHHIHHSDRTSFKSAKDYIGCNVTYLRSPSSADLWHSDNQFKNLVAVEGFIHSKNNGRIAHLTHYF